MKKRMLAIMMSALMAAGVCSGVTVYADADSKTLTVGFDAEYPPFGYMDENGEYVGFDLDIAQKVCDNLGWELVKKPINWDSKDMELNSETSTASGTASRSTDVRTTTPGLIHI